MITSQDRNRSSISHFIVYNENGYQITVPTQREYWFHWDQRVRVDPNQFHLHKMDLMDTGGFLFMSARTVQLQDHWTVREGGGRLGGGGKARSESMGGGRGR